MAPESRDPIPAVESSTPGPAPPRRPSPLARGEFDAQGHWIIPARTEADREARVKAVERMFGAINQIPNGPDEDDRDFFRVVDEQRPHRPLFEGLH